MAESLVVPREEDIVGRNTTCWMAFRIKMVEKSIETINTSIEAIHLHLYMLFNY